MLDLDPRSNEIPKIIISLLNQLRGVEMLLNDSLRPSSADLEVCPALMQALVYFQCLLHVLPWVRFEFRRNPILYLFPVSHKMADSSTLDLCRLIRKV